MRSQHPQNIGGAGFSLPMRAEFARGLWTFMACSRPPRWGRQSCLQAAFRPPSALNRPLTQFARIFSGFVCRGHGAVEPEKFASKQRGGLKPACSQDWLPHENAKLQRRPFRPSSNRNRHFTQFAGVFSGFVSRRHRAAKPEEFISKRGGRLKASLQPGLAAPREAKVQAGESACPTEAAPHEDHRDHHYPQRGAQCGSRH